MNAIDQHNAIISWEQSLVPAPALIDGRTEQDRLAFLCDYASLINFYDGNNMRKGNWAPFLLKDPVFLLASISKTRFQAFHSRYLNSCAALQQAFKSQKNGNDVGIIFNQLFEQFTDVFMHIKQWIYFMQKTNDEYDLKAYITHETKTNFSRYYWAITSLQQNLYIWSVIPGIKPVDHHQFYFFDAYEEVIWKQNKGKTPYLDILGLKNPITDNTDEIIYEALKKAGDKLFVFFHTLISSADTEFVKLKVKKSRYPDTTLLRTFVDLLQAHQDQLNGIAQKHLHFYYNDILKQELKPAAPDSVFLCSTLAKSTSTFTLPAGTVFNAGLDAQKKPILFSTAEAVNLNPATISGGYTLFGVTNPDNKISSLYRQNIPAAGAIQKDSTGKVQPWETFGGPATPQGTLINPAIAFASPLLYLQEGQREITLALSFADDQFDTTTLPPISYFLSTANGWLDVTQKVKPIASVSSVLNVEIILESTDAPIEAFKKINPDKLDSQWPLLKLEFGSFTNLASPPVINKITISVNVFDVKTFTLYNDYGTLSTKTPYPPFGPTPMVNSNFIIGSSEIFSKPVSALIIELNWDQLPPDFSLYYERYNAYIKNKVPPLPAPPPPLQPATTRWQKIKNWIKGLIHSQKKEETGDPFNNNCFTVDFGVLQSGEWKELYMTPFEENPDKTLPYEFVLRSNSQHTGHDVPLFAEDIIIDNDNSMRLLENSSIFGYPPIPWPQVTEITPVKPVIQPTFPVIADTDPGIQNSPLKFTDASSSGFMKMTLSGPQLYGFGSGVYANVVSCVALTNAMHISKSICPPPFSPPASLPYVPKIKSFTGYYSASCTYQFPASSTPETYPIQCFLYSPFNNYLVYDNSQPAVYNYTIGGSGTTATTTGIPLFETFNYDGYLFLELQNLLPASSLNLYFELARNYTDSAAGAKAACFYVNNNGWSELPVLSDGTNNFSCSGIIKVSIPDDITNKGPVIPGTGYWICIAVSNNAASIAQTVFYQSNGFIATRSSNISTSATAPKLAAGTISKPQTAIPQLSATTQPFPSFGGKATETHTGMNQRVSSRLRTKDRAIAAGDYSMLIKQEFSDIFYARPVFDPQTGNTTVYVVKACSDWTDPGAFLPMISECREEKIGTYLGQRTAAFEKTGVSNFDFQYVNVRAIVAFAPGFEKLVVKNNADQVLNIFLSPWISSSEQQVIICQTISDSMIAKLLMTIPGIASVESVQFESWTMEKSSYALIQKTLPAGSTISPFSKTALLVSNMHHHIDCK